MRKIGALMSQMRIMFESKLICFRNLSYRTKGHMDFIVVMS